MYLIKTLFTVVCVLSFSQVRAQNINRVKEPSVLRELYRREILIPDIQGFKTLKCDFHMHTVFSDGDVWPTIRVQEAYYEGLDAIAITEHIEYRPKRDYVKGDHNTAYIIAKPEAERMNILLVKSGEISRSMPPGHLNALFLTDANKLEVEDYMDAIEEANRQGAFLFWAHPGWAAQQPDTTLWWDEHEEIFQKGWLHGIEVYNWDEWYPVSFDWCNEKNLAYLGNSDIHIVASHRFNLDKYFRPMTLVFAQNRSIESLKEAMFERRTVAFFLNQLVGPEDLLQSLFKESVQVGKPFYTQQESLASVVIKNPTDLTFILENQNPVNGAPKRIALYPRSSLIIRCELNEGQTILPYLATNLHIRSDKKLDVQIVINK